MNCPYQHDHYNIYTPPVKPFKLFVFNRLRTFEYKHITACGIYTYTPQNALPIYPDPHSIPRPILYFVIGAGMHATKF